MGNEEKPKPPTTLSGQMRAVTTATMQDVASLEERLTKRVDDSETRLVKNIEDSEARMLNKQRDYEAKCEADRKDLHGEVESVKTMVTRVESKTDSLTTKTDQITTWIQPLSKMFDSVFSHPKVQSAAIVAVVAILGFVAWKLNSMTGNNPPPPPNTPIIVIPQSQLTDGGTPSVTVQTH